MLVEMYPVELCPNISAEEDLHLLPQSGEPVGN